jgi:hypothetical protein
MATRFEPNPPRRRRRIRVYRDRERLDGIDPTDAAARWLELNDPALRRPDRDPPVPTPKENRP